MRTLYIAFLFLLFVGLSLIWIGVILKIIEEMNKIHLLFCMFVPIVLVVWYLTSGLCFTAINRQFKLRKFSNR